MSFVQEKIKYISSISNCDSMSSASSIKGNHKSDQESMLVCFLVFQRGESNSGYFHQPNSGFINCSTWCQLVGNDVFRTSYIFLIPPSKRLSNLYYACKEQYLSLLWRSQQSWCNRWDCFLLSVVRRMSYIVRRVSSVSISFRANYF